MGTPRAAPRARRRRARRAGHANTRSPLRRLRNLAQRLAALERVEHREFPRPARGEQRDADAFATRYRRIDLRELVEIHDDALEAPLEHRGRLVRHDARLEANELERCLEARGEELVHRAPAIGLLDRTAVAVAEITPHQEPRALARSPADELQALETRIGAGQLRARDREGGEDLGEAPFVLDQPEDGKQPCILGEGRLLVVRQLRRRSRTIAYEAREFFQVELDHPEDLLYSLEREGAVGEHALHRRLGDADLFRE